MKANFFSNNKNIVSIFSLVLLLVLIFSNSTLAANDPQKYTSSLVKCGNSVDGNIANPCDFDDFVNTINRIINWIIASAGVIFTISLIYGGFLYVTSGVNPGNRETAKKVLWSTLKGFVIILISWLIVYTILKVMVPSGSSVFRFIGSGN